MLRKFVRAVAASANPVIRTGTSTNARAFLDDALNAAGHLASANRIKLVAKDIAHNEVIILWGNHASEPRAVGV